MKIVKFVVANRVSDILKKRLEGENLSKVARELGISKSLLADWVASRRLPSLRNIESVAKIAAHLGLTLDQLLLGHEDQRKIISAVTFDDDGRRYRIYIERLR